MSIHISCDMYLRLGLHLQITLYYVLPYKAKISAQHGIGFILDRGIVCLGLTMPNLQKKRLLIFEIFNITKYTLFFGTEYTFTFLTCLSRGERRKYTGNKFRLNRVSNSQPPGHEFDTLTTKPPGGLDTLLLIYCIHLALNPNSIGKNEEVP